MHRHLYVSIAGHGGLNEPQRLEPMMGLLAADWIRWTASDWVLWTDKKVVTVTEMLKTQLAPGTNFMVVVISNEEQPNGIQQKWVWDWINAARDPVTGARLAPPTPQELAQYATPLLTPPKQL